MILDFAQSETSIFETDICIIGSGAAGFTCAVSLLSSRLKVLLVEGGLKNFNKAAADIHKAEIVSHPHGGIHDARERIVGGTTTKWGGQALPFLKEDFYVRKHIPFSGWPITLDELMPYYKKVESILGTDVNIPYNYNPWVDWHISVPMFKDDRISLFVTKWCKVPNFASQHSFKINESQNVTLLLNANVTSLVSSTTKDSVDYLTVKSLDNKEGIIKAKYVIAAGGAIETVRLFLVSKSFSENGLGNDNGLVGLFFQDHVACIAGQIFPISRKSFQNLFDPFYKNGFKYFPRLKLNPKTAENKKVLHASAQVIFTETNNNILGIAKSIIKELKNKKLPSIKDLKLILNPFNISSVFEAAVRWKYLNRGSSPNSGPIWLEIHSEQNPDKENYIKLSDKTDNLGINRVQLHWTISELTKLTVQEMAMQVKECLEEAGIAKVLLEPWVKEEVITTNNWFKDAYHQAGGLRMSYSRLDGVVDQDCKVFGINNLYVGSSAVFPTSSFSNPTMTAMALSIRICDKILSII